MRRPPELVDAGFAAAHRDSQAGHLLQQHAELIVHREANKAVDLLAAMHRARRATPAGVL